MAGKKTSSSGQTLSRAELVDGLRTVGVEAGDIVLHIRQCGHLDTSTVVRTPSSTPCWKWSERQVLSSFRIVQVRFE